MLEQNGKKIFLLLCLFNVAHTNIRVGKQIYFKIEGYLAQDTSWVNFFIEYYVTDILIMTVLIGIILFITKKMIQKKYSRLKTFLFHLIFAFVTWLLTYFIYYAYLLSLKKIHLETLDWKRIIFELLDYSDKHFIFYFTNVFIIYTYYYINKNMQIEVQKAKIKQQLANVQVNILKYQLHPHFFFNTLNNISSLIDIDPKLAQNTLADFSDLLRDILFLKDENLMPLSIEMKILNRYINIMTIRFSDHLNVNISMDDNLNDILIPSLILQPIVENSIKHGYSYDSTDLKIDISVFIRNTKLHIEIQNNGKPLSQNINYGNGIQNTINRLKTLYENEFIFEIKNNKKNNGVITNIIIPIKL